MRVLICMYVCVPLTGVCTDCVCVPLTGVCVCFRPQEGSDDEEGGSRQKKQRKPKKRMEKVRCVSVCVTEREIKIIVCVCVMFLLTSVRHICNVWH